MPDIHQTLNTADLVTIEHVPIFKPTQRDGFVVESEKLKQVVAVNNARYQAGEFTTIVIGHTDTADEKPSLGFIDHLYLGVRNGVETIFARFKVFKDRLDDLRSFPKRSIEINSKSLVMPAIALLGGSKPYHDLGVLFAGDAVKFRFEALNTFTEHGETMDLTDELKQAIVELVNSLPELAWAKAKMESEAEKPQDEPETNEDETKEDEVKDNEDDPKEGDSKDDEEEKLGDKRHVVMFAEIKKEVAQLRKDLRRAKREKFLMTKNIPDLEEVLSFSENFDDEQFAKYIDQITKYSAPVGRRFSVAKPPVEGGVERFSEQQIAAVRAYAHKHGVSYSEAKAQLNS